MNEHESNLQYWSLRLSVVAIIISLVSFGYTVYKDTLDSTCY